MDITDTQVLSQLKLRRLKLKMELDRVEIAIRAFTDLDEKKIELLDSLPYMLDDIPSAPDNDEMAKAILMYNPKDSYAKKIKYVLTKIEEGTATQICEYLLRIDRHVRNINKFHQQITYSASRMYKQGEIDARQQGRVNVYRKRKETT